MSKSQRTPIPLPGSSASKRKNSEKTSSKEPFKSQEFIDSSDDSATEEPAKSKNVTKHKDPKSPAKIGVHKPNGVAKKTKVPLPVSKPPKKVVTEPQQLSSSSSDSDESTETPAKVPQNQGVESTGTNNTTESGTTESSSDSSSDESEDESTAKAPQNSEEAGQVRSQPTSHTVEFRPVQPFVPPKGFNAVPTPLKATSAASKVFDNIEGKQIWHITAPAGVSIARLEQLAMDKVRKGDAILEHKGTDYGLKTREESEEASRALMVPRQNGYEAVSVPISQTFHLQQVLRLPNLTTKQADPNTGSQAAASITQSTIRAPRPQVKGLKMRYFHSGFGEDEPGTIGSSDDEEVPRGTAGLGVPNGIQVLRKPEKRKHDDANGSTESPSKKHKKHKTAEEVKRKEEKKARKEKKRAAESARASS